MSLQLEGPAGEVELQLQRQLQAHRRAQIGRRKLEAVAWLALAPRWAAPLAAGFPLARRQKLEHFVQEAAADGLCELARSGSAERARPRVLEVLAALGPALPPALVEGAVEFASEDDPHALAALASALPAEPAAALAARASSIEAAADRALVLTALLARVGPDARLSVLSAALDAAREAPPRSRAQCLVALADAAPELAGEALDSIRDTRGAATRARMLARLAPHYAAHPEPLLAAVRELPDPALRVEPALRAGATDDEVSGWVREIRSAAGRDAARRGLAGALAHAGRRRDAEAETQRIERDDIRALAFGELAAAFGDDAGAYRESVRLALADTVAPWRSVAVRASIARSLVRAGRSELARELVAEAVELAGRQRPTTEGLVPLCALGELGIDGMAERALAIARSIGGDRERCEALLAVAPLLSGDEFVGAVSDARAALRLIADPLERAPLLGAFMPLLPEADGVELVTETTALAADTAEELAFWVPDPLRLELLAILSEDGLDLCAVAGKAGAAVMRAVAAGTPAAANIRRWAELAQAYADHGPHGPTEAFLERHRGALRAADAASALDWIDTGAFLAETANDGRLAGAVRYARRKMELVYREAQDRRAPEPFLERKSQLDAFQDLRSDDGTAWALHYVGTGGVGKSTLIRHLQRRALREGFVTAKVDFDYLSADYPVKRPAELLLQLMAELELHAFTEHERYLVSFRDAVVKLHEERVESGAVDPEAELDKPQFQAALRAFCNYLTALDQDVVLFLDTCEELTRFQPRDKPADNVRAAFSAIERIHAGYTRVRVVLAGRRLLAAGGYGNWKAAGGIGAAQPRRDYLRIHRIEGFSEREAERFLRRIRGLKLDPDLERAVLKASPESKLEVPLEWDPPRKPEKDKRCNPFDLGMYADWIAQDGPMDPKALESHESDPYVDLRIVRRLKGDKLPGLVELLPAVALLWRFDDELIRPAFTGPAAFFRRVFEDYADQEWISAGETELVVEANLRPRLFEYVGEPARQAAGARLADGVEARLRTLPLGELTAEHLEAAVEILDPATFTAVWHGLVEKVADGGNWHWAERVAGRLLGDEGALTGRDHPARAAVVAAFASARAHVGVTSELATFWTEVEAATGRDPDPEARAWLAARAFAAQVIVTPSLPGAAKRLRALVLADPPAGRHRAEQYSAALLAALERLGDLTSVCSGQELAAWADGLRVLEVGPELQAAVRILAARALPAGPARAGQVKLALHSVESPPAECAQRWLDWIAPASPRDRVRLEALQLGATPEPSWGEDAVTRIATIDAERLLSALLERELADAPIPSARLAELRSSVRYVADRQPVCAAHRAVRPLFVTIALGWASLGDRKRALDLLDEHIAAAGQSAHDPGTVRAGELAKLEVLRRFRCDDPLLIERAISSDDPADLEAALALAALIWPPGELPDDVPWRYQVGLSPHRERRLAAFDVVDPLDEAEYRKLTGAGGLPLLGEPELDGPEDLRSALRHMALAAFGPERLAAGSTWWERPLRYAGPRRLAELALEEGELMALRLPREALPLLTAARDLFRRAGDPFGVLVATIRLTLASAHAEATEQRGRLAAALDDAVRDAQPAGGWSARFDLARQWSQGETVEDRRDPAPPVELDLDPASQDTAPPTRWVSVAGGIAGALAGVAGATWGIAVIVRWLLGAASVEVSQGAAVGIVVALVALAVLVGWSVRMLLRDLPVNPLALTSLRLSISDDHPEPAGPAWPVPRDITLQLEQFRPALAGSRMRLPTLLRLMLRGAAALRLTAGEATRAGWRSPAPAGYGNAASGFPPELSVELRDLLGAAGLNARPPLVVEAAPSLAGLPWESFVASSVDERLQPFRSARRGGSSPGWPPPRELPILFMVGAEWRRLVTEGWAGWDGPVMRAEQPLPSAGIRCLHAIGHPISGTAGQLLQVGSEPSPAATVEQAVRASGLVAGASALSTGGAITILQAEPVDVGARFDTDRETACKLRMLAADVFTAGAEAVLIIPALPSELATAVVRRVAARLRPPRRYGPRRLIESIADDVIRRLGGVVDREQHRLLTLTAELRVLIREHDGPPEVLDELAADVCLFANADAVYAAIAAQETAER